MKTQFKLIDARRGLELCTLIGGFGCRSLFAVYWDGRIFQLDVLFVHLFDYKRRL